MKNQATKGITLFLVILLFIPYMGIAQDSDSAKMKPTVVMSQNMVPLADMGRYVELSNKYWAPAFDKLVDEGKLYSWGFLTHAWGDEWNVVVHYAAKDFASFQSAWNEGMKMFTESIPEELNDEMTRMIKAHKDGIYTGQHYYDGHK